MSYDIAKIDAVARQKMAVAVTPAIALGTDDETPIFVAPAPCKITEVGVVPDTAVTGDDTDNYTLSFVNKGSDGSGTDVIAEKEYATGVNGVKDDYEDYGTVSNNVLAKGDVVALEKVEANSGLGKPVTLAVIRYEITKPA